MKKRKSRSRNNGDRIYRRHRDETKTETDDEAIDEQANGYIQSALTDNTFSGSYIDDDDFSRLGLLLPDYPQEQSPGGSIEQIADQDIQAPSSRLAHSRSSGDCSFTIDDLLSSAEKPQSRKQLLNDYIEQRIEDGSGRCGCSFDCTADSAPRSSTQLADPGSSNLLNNLDKSHERLQQRDRVLHERLLVDINTRVASAEGDTGIRGNAYLSNHGTNSLAGNLAHHSNSVFIEPSEDPQISAFKPTTVADILDTLLDSNNNNNDNSRIGIESSLVELYFADSSDSEGCANQFETSNALASLADSIYDRGSPAVGAKQTRARAYSLTSSPSRPKACKNYLSALDLEHRVSDWAQYQREHQKSLDCSLTNNNSTFSLSWSQELPCNIATPHNKNNNYNSRALSPRRVESERAEEDHLSWERTEESVYKSCNERGLTQKCIVPLHSEDFSDNPLAAQPEGLDGCSRVLSLPSSPKRSLNESQPKLVKQQQQTIAEIVGDLMDSGDNETSMKAAKDIAKMSIPSLSALQYLPSQIDAKKKLFRNQQEANEISENEQQQQQQHAMTSKTQVDSKLKIRVITESCEDFRHDESCLFDRLCLCNCMATRSQHQQQSASRQSPSSSTSSFPGNDDKLARRRSKREKGSSSPTKRRADGSRDGISEKRQSSDALGVGRATDTDAATGEQKYEQKQSPSFLNLLKSTLLEPRDPRQGGRRELHLSSSDKPDDSYHANPKSSAGLYANIPSRSPLESTPTAKSLSESPLETFSLPLNADKGSNNNNLDKKKTKRPSRFSSSERPSSGTLSDEPAPSSVESQDRSQSACSSTDCRRELELLASDEIAVGERSKAKKRASGRNYRKYLSPSRLFATANKSDSEPQETSQQHQQSFFTRSLNRLSHRRASSKRKSQVVSQESLDSQSTCGIESESSSVPYSISSSSRCKKSSVAANSLESINLDETLYSSRLGASQSSTPSKSKILVAPDIVLHTVERVQSSETKVKPMTRTGNYRYSSSDSIAGRNIRCESELDYGNYYLDESERAYSRSSSPGGVRRRAGRGSRSPRLRESPVPFKSPVTQSTKIEDGLRVCSIEHFEKHIGNIKDNQVEAQKRLFKAWINHFCPNLIQQDLVEELRDGIKLVGLLAYLTRDKQLLTQYEKLQQDRMSYVNRLVITPSSRLKQLSNVSIAIDYLRKTVGMKLINLNPMDVVSGKPNVILGLCWSIILHFQLEQNFLRYLESCDGGSENSSLTSHCTSRLSASLTNEDGARLASSSGRQVANCEDYSAGVLVAAKRRLLKYINARFNLKLTNLTSNLLDPDVMLIMIGNLVQSEDGRQAIKQLQGSSWLKMDDDEKLDSCFDLAQKYLNIPCLMSASDLRQQTISDNNSKPLLVYLSMLLNVNESIYLRSKLSPIESSKECIVGKDRNAENTIETYLKEIETTQDKFAIDKIQSTLEKIKQLEDLVSTSREGELDPRLAARVATLRVESEHIEKTVQWINEADGFFEMRQRSIADLHDAIASYRTFFAPENVPPAREISVCPTLERQYRECLSTAEQRIISMEQTLSNWLCYDQARRDLSQWLMLAEEKLSQALGPLQLEETTQDQHLDRLQDLIEYFELEDIDVILAEPDHLSQLELSGKLARLDDRGSFSGSRLSLGSTSSRLSTLQTSKSAAYHGLFNEFELKCRLLAATLDSEQRASLLLGVKDLKSRLKHIMDQRVPQVVNELRLSINQSRLIAEASEDDGSDEEPEQGTSAQEDPQLELQSEDLEPEFDQESGSPDVNTETAINLEVEDTRMEKSADKKTSKAPKTRQKNNKPSSKSSKKCKPSSPQQQKPCASNRPDIDTAFDENARHWSLMNWMLGKRVDKSQDAVKPGSRAGKSRRKRNNKSPLKVKPESTSDDPKELPLAKLIWSKLKRAYKTSLSLNIILLICLAGICIVPLINKDACCELTQGQTPFEDSINVVRKPI